MGIKVGKTEHVGAKNGGGYWGKRDIAKEGSRKARREAGKRIIREEKTDSLLCRYSDCPEGHPVGADDDPVTCPTCRKDLGLPAID